ncbi:MAG: hypothetical protein PQJ58_06355 [Spirochaetales bacterium]|nr:hypothetical protein [Spirochaetales bacterium]
MNVHYDFLGIDEGKQNLLKGNTGSETILWTRSLADYPTARALQRLDENRILMGYDRGYCIFDQRTGEILHDCSLWSKVTSAFRTSEGSTLITGQDLEEQSGVCVLTLDSSDRVINTKVCPGNYVRLMSVTQDGRYLLSTNDHIKICDKNLNTQATLAADGFLHAWQSLVLEDGTILVSAGYGGFIARFSDKGELLSTFGGKREVPKEVNPFFYASFRKCEDGSLLLANWQGHGPDNGELGRQLIHFSAEGEYLESCSFPDDVSSLQGLLLL